VALVKILDGPAVADDEAVELPLLPQDIDEERLAAQQGSPFVRLYAPMMLFAFASTMQA
jgi:hypothetical protein